MKKLIYLATFVVALTVAGSCSKDDVVGTADDSQSVIGFDTYTPKSMRGVVTTTANLKDHPFEIFAYKADAPKARFMGTSNTLGVKIAYKSDTWGYADATQKAYWPGDPVNFFAVWPADNNAVTKDIGAETQKLIYRTPDLCENQFDLLFTEVLGASYGFRDGKGKAARNTGALSLVFDHTLAQVLFKAKTAVDAFKVDIASIEICNVMNSGEYVIDISTPSRAWDNVTYDGNSNFKAGIATPVTGISTTVTDLTTSAAGALLLIPQKLTKWTTTSEMPVTLPEAQGTSYLKIMCKIINTQGGDSYLYGDKDTYKPVYIPFNADWNSGYKYTYTIVFGNVEGQGGGGGFDDKGNPVLNDLLITFDPSVTPWTDQTPNPDLDM